MDTNVVNEPVVAKKKAGRKAKAGVFEQVVELKESGMKTKEIADKLCISPSSVSAHLKKAGLTRTYTASATVQKLSAGLSDATKASMKADLEAQRDNLRVEQETVAKDRAELEEKIKLLGRGSQSLSARLRGLDAKIAGL